MAGSSPTFRTVSVSQLVNAAVGKELMEPAYSFSDGRTFSRRVQQPSAASSILNYSNTSNYSDLDHYYSGTTDTDTVTTPDVSTGDGDSYVGLENYTDQENYN